MARNELDVAGLRRAPGIRRRLRAGRAAGRRAHPTVELDDATFAREVLGRIAARLERAGAAVDRAAVQDGLDATCLPDLYLSVACDLGRDGAWERLMEAFGPRVDGLARSLGMAGAAASVGADLLGDLARPPANASARTRLGTYDGSGSLFAWLAVILRRQGATRARRKTRPPASVEPASLDRRHAPGDSDPLGSLLDAEEGTRIVNALQAAWRTLSSREQLALHLRYGESLTLEQTGRLLDLGESGTSRLVKRALDRLRSHVRPMIANGVIPPARMQLWSALWRACGTERESGEGAS